MKTEYAIKDYASGDTVGVVRLDGDEFASYEAMAQQPEGILPCRDLLDAFPAAVMAEPFDGDMTVWLE